VTRLRVLDPYVASVARQREHERRARAELYRRSGDVIPFPINKRGGTADTARPMTPVDSLTVDDYWLAQKPPKATLADRERDAAAMLAAACDEATQHLDLAANSLIRLGDLAWSGYHKAALARLAESVTEARRGVLVLHRTASQEAGA